VSGGDGESDDVVADSQPILPSIGKDDISWGWDVSAEGQLTTHM